MRKTILLAVAAIMLLGFAAPLSKKQPAPVLSSEGEPLPLPCAPHCRLPGHP